MRRKKDQVQLLEKTAQYINNLKKTINEKNRKIKGLEKRLSSGNRTNDIPSRSFEDGDADDMNDNFSDFNDNYSVKVKLMLNLVLKQTRRQQTQIEAA